MKTMVYGTSIKGNGHYITGRECQDSNSFDVSDFSDDPIKCIAIADGHGGAPYFRSSIGSAIAVRIAKDYMHNFIYNNIALLDKIDAINNQSARIAPISYETSEKRMMNSWDKKIDKLQKQIDSYNRILKFVELRQRLLEEKNKASAERVESIESEIKQLNKTLSRQEMLICNKNLSKGIVSLKRKALEDCHKLLYNEINLKLDDLKSDILNAWEEEIDEHIANDPVSVSSVNMYKIDSLEPNAQILSFVGYSKQNKDSLNMVNRDLSHRAIDKIIVNYRQIYGTTLLCIATYKQHNFVLQIGDGDVVVIKDDNSIYFPIEKDDNQIANETNSICQKDAIDHFKSLYFYEQIKMMLVSTDGVANALEQESELGNLALGIYENINEEPNTFREEFKPLLRKCSDGSSDDCTIGLIANGIFDENFEIIHRGKESEVESTLELMYKPQFKFYSISKDYFADSKAYTIGSQIALKSFAHMSETIFKECYQDHLEEIEDYIVTIKEIKKSNWRNSILLKKLKDENDRILAARRNEINRILSEDYSTRIRNYLKTNPILLMECNTSTITVESEMATVTQTTTIHGIVNQIQDNTITFRQIKQDYFEMLVEKMRDVFLYQGRIVLEEGYYIDINKLEIKLQQEEKQ